MPAHDRIVLFLAAVRSRLERARGIRVFFTVLLLVLALLTAWCLGWVLRGYAVPTIGFWVALAAVPLLVVLGMAWRRTSSTRAARAADDHFGLKDALTSYLGFSSHHRDGDLYALQASQTAERVQSLSASSVPVTWPRRFTAVSAILLVACVVMGFRKASPFVLEKIATEEETVKKTAEINKELEEEIEELLKSASDKEKEMLQPDQWRQWVKELRETRDQKEAMRQYAELERRLHEAAQRMNQREQEQLMSKAAEELKQEDGHKETARKLQEKSYREAAADLQRLALKADVSKPDEARRELAKLKAASMRLAAAAREFQQRTGRENGSGKSPSSSQNQSSSGSKSGQQSQAEGQQGENSSSMDQQMTALEAALQEYDRSLQQKTSPSQCQSSQQNANQKLNSLCQSMCKAAARRDLQKKLSELSLCASKCQGYLGNKECQSLAECMNPGQQSGQKPGWASADSRRAISELFQDNGSRDQLQGIKGQGPSNTSVEAADSGTGAASRQVRATEHAWKRQLEAFIQREDVPAEVKAGVREYFKGIQEVGSEVPAETQQ